MLTAEKVINQTVRVPRDFAIDEGDELYVNRIGNTLIMTPVSRLAEVFEQEAAILASLDFMKDGLPDEIPVTREKK